MVAFSQNAADNTIYLLPWSEEGYTLMTMTNPHYPNQNILIVKEIFDSKGEIVGMSEKGWDSMFRESHPIFGLWSYLELKLIALPVLKAVEIPAFSDEEEAIPLAASS